MSSTKNIINSDNNTVVQKRGRGRPRLDSINNVKTISNINKKNDKKNDKKNQQIILQLQLDDDSDSDKKNTSDSTKKKVSLKDMLITTTYKTDNYTDVNSDSEEFDNSILIKELKKKDIIIKKLKQQIESFRNSDTNFDQFDNKKEYNVILDKFKSSKLRKKIVNAELPNLTMVDKTDLKCWNCTYNFDTIPLFIVNTQDESGIYHVFGCFCSDSCALSYNIHEINDHRIQNRKTLTIKLFCEIFNKNIFEYQPNIAPRKEVLKDYGGIMDIMEYRYSSNMCKYEYKSNIPPMLYSYLEIEQIKK